MSKLGFLISKSHALPVTWHVYPPNAYDSERKGDSQTGKESALDQYHELKFYP